MTKPVRAAAGNHITRDGRVRQDGTTLFGNHEHTEHDPDAAPQLTATDRELAALNRLIAANQDELRAAETNLGDALVAKAGILIREEFGDATTIDVYTEHGVWMISAIKNGRTTLWSEKDRRNNPISDISSLTVGRIPRRADSVIPDGDSIRGTIHLPKPAGEQIHLAVADDYDLRRIFDAAVEQTGEVYLIHTQESLHGRAQQYGTTPAANELWEELYADDIRIEGFHDRIRNAASYAGYEQLDRIVRDLREQGFPGTAEPVIDDSKRSTTDPVDLDRIGLKALEDAGRSIRMRGYLINAGKKDLEFLVGSPDQDEQVWSSIRASGRLTEVAAKMNEVYDKELNAALEHLVFKGVIKPN